jgi:long-chain acyl-CoA synthetase
VGVVKLTSGSTGTPRGVAVSMEALLADDAALASSMGLRDDDRILGGIPLSHSYGLSSVALPALARGSLIVLPEEAQPLAALAAARDSAATFFPTAPAYLQALLRMSRPPNWPPSMRLVISASAPLAPATAARFRETYGQHVHVFYGASECGGICYDRDGGAAERGTIGPPVDGVRVTLEPMDGATSGDTGIVTVSSPAVAECYFPEANPRLGSGRFVTSDVATWRDGEIALRGRIDGLINVKGKKVDPLEIQRVLEGLTGVEEVVALGVPAPGNGGEVVRAVIACKPGRLTYTDVLDWCRSRLADHKVPRSVILVPAIPRNELGKISRVALAALEAPAGSSGG